MKMVAVGIWDGHDQLVAVKRGWKRVLIPGASSTKEQRESREEEGKGASSTMFFNGEIVEFNNGSFSSSM